MKDYLARERYDTFFRNLLSFKWAHILVFVCLVFGVSFFTHILVFFSIDFFWDIEMPWPMIVFFSALFPGLFFVATGWVHKWEGALSRKVYLVSSIWLGFFVFLFFSVFLTWGVFWIGVLVDWDISLGVVFTLLVIGSVGAVFHGIHNAFHPRVRHIEVFIRDLPEHWEGKKIVQLSDVHLGAIYGASHFRDIAKMANAEKPEIIVFTGDTFDGMDGSLPSLVEPLSRVRAKSGCFFIIGNHETYLGVEKAINVIRKTRIHILDDAVADVHGLKVIGLSYPDRGERKFFVKRLEQLQSQYHGHPSLLLMHAPEKIKKISRMGISLQLSGHTHRGQIMPFNVMTYLAHKGFDYGKFEIGDYTLYTTNGIGTWGPPIRFGNVPEIVSVTVRRKPDGEGNAKKEGHIRRGVKKVARGVGRVAHGVGHVAKEALRKRVE